MLFYPLSSRVSLLLRFPSIFIFIFVFFFLLDCSYISFLCFPSSRLFIVSSSLILIHLFLVVFSSFAGHLHALVFFPFSVCHYFKAYSSFVSPYIIFFLLLLSSYFVTPSYLSSCFYFASFISFSVTSSSVISASASSYFLFSYILLLSSNFFTSYDSPRLHLFLLSTLLTSRFSDFW